jgi:hypothetical protein
MVERVGVCCANGAGSRVQGRASSGGAPLALRVGGRRAAEQAECACLIAVYGLLGASRKVLVAVLGVVEGKTARSASPQEAHTDAGANPKAPPLQSIAGGTDGRGRLDAGMGAGPETRWEVRAAGMAGGRSRGTWGGSRAKRRGGGRRWR